jgi:hypothetical protein
MRRAVQLFAVLFIAALGTAACVGKGRNAPTPQETASVRVINRAFIDVDVFVLNGTLRTRLGTVTGGGSGTFRLPVTVVGSGRDLRFLVDPIGSDRQAVTFNSMYVRPGQRVTLTVPATIQ